MDKSSTFFPFPGSIGPNKSNMQILLGPYIMGTTGVIGNTYCWRKPPEATYIHITMVGGGTGGGAGCSTTTTAANAGGGGGGATGVSTYWSGPASSFPEIIFFYVPPGRAGGTPVAGASGNAGEANSLNYHPIAMSYKIIDAFYTTGSKTTGAMAFLSNTSTSGGGGTSAAGGTAGAAGSSGSAAAGIMFYPAYSAAIPTATGTAGGAGNATGNGTQGTPAFYSGTYLTLSSSGSGGGGATSSTAGSGGASGITATYSAWLTIGNITHGSAAGAGTSGANSAPIKVPTNILPSRFTEIYGSAGGGGGGLQTDAGNGGHGGPGCGGGGGGGSSLGLGGTGGDGGPGYVLITWS